jgi:hypothetical protein
MAPEFDPYREWLGADAPPDSINHYQLLGLRPFESDQERIENTEMVQMAKVLRHELGPHGQYVPKLCQELEAAVRCLGDPAAKAAYDAQLRASLSVKLPAAAGVAPVAQTDSKLGQGYNFAANLHLSASEDALGDDFPAAAPAPSQKPVSAAGASPSSLSRRATDTTKRTPSQGHAAEDDDADVLAGDDPGRHPRRPGDRANSSLSSKSSLKHQNSPASSVQGRSTGQSAISKSKQRPPAARRRPGLADSLSEIPLQTLATGAAAVAVIFLAIWFVPKLWNSGPDPGPYLAKLKDADPLVRMEGIDALRFLDLDESEKARLLMRILKDDRSDSVRIAAVNSLTTVGPLPAETLPELKQLLANEKHPSVKPLLVWLVERQESAAAP